jgi:hypothetical protein
MLLWSYQLHLLSSKAYNFFRDSVLVLPCQSYPRRLTSCLSLSSNLALDTNSHLAYLKNKVSELEPNSKFVSLLIDKIYVEPNICYKGDTIQGFAGNNPKKKAKTVQAFMLSSLLSKKNTDIVALAPMINSKAADLKEITLKVLDLVHTIGYKVVCMISDNNRINRNMFGFLCNGKM